MSLQIKKCVSTSLMFFIAFGIVSGATITWDGGGADDNWDTTANWVGDANPTWGSDDIVFTGATRTTPSINTSQTVTAITFDASANAFTIGAGGGTITTNGNITNNDADNQTINAPIALGGASTFAATSGNLVIGGVVSGANNLNITGSATTTTLSATNTYTGTTTVTSGGLIVTGSTHASSAVTVGGSGTLYGTGTINGNLSTNANGILAPGTGYDNVGTLSVNSNGGSLDDGVFLVEISNIEGGTAGTHHDYLDFTGTAFDLSTLSGNPLTIRLENSTTYFEAAEGITSWGDSTNWGNAGAGDLKIMNNVSNFNASYFSIESNILSLNWELKHIGGAGGALWLSYTTVPEPSTYLMITLMAGFIGFTIAKRKIKSAKKIQD